MVYGAAVALLVLSFAARIPEFASYFEVRRYNAFPSEIIFNDFEREGQSVIIGVAVLLVLGWEVAKAGYRTLSESGPLLVGIVVAIPVALPLTALAAWLAKLLEPNLPDHPLFTHLVSLPIGVGITVYALTTALTVVLLKELRNRQQADA